MTESLLFMGHGSRDSEAVDECMSMAEDVEKEIGQQFTPGFLELSKPLLFPEIVRQIDNGVRRFLCFPNMLLPGRHTMDHLPGVLGWAQRHFPEVEFYYGNFIGNHPLVFEILYNNYRKSKEDLAGPVPDISTAVVVVGRGSSSDRSNKTFEKMVRRFQKKFEIPNVTHCYVSLTPPDIPSTLHRIAGSGNYRNVLVLPYFLFTGVLYKRIKSITEDVSRHYQRVQFSVGDYFGKDERLKNIIESRVRELFERPRNHRENDFTEISEQAGHHLHHLDVFGDEPAADYLQDIPGCPDHRHPAKYMDDYRHGHQQGDHENN